MVEGGTEILFTNGLRTVPANELLNWYSEMFHLHDTGSIPMAFNTVSGVATLMSHGQGFKRSEDEQNMGPTRNIRHLGPEDKPQVRADGKGNGVGAGQGYCTVCNPPHKRRVWFQHEVEGGEMLSALVTLRSCHRVDATPLIPDWPTEVSTF
jgi:hypothetical protein